MSEPSGCQPAPSLASSGGQAGGHDTKEARNRFDGGVRGVAPAHRSDPTLRPLLERQAYREPGGWHAVELEDGADLFFGQLGER